MRTLYVARHGETEYTRKELFMGRLDIGLNQTGRQQAEELGRKLQGCQIGRIMTSPLSRCRETAEIVSRQLKVPIAVDARLVERDIGEMEGESKAKVFQQHRKSTGDVGKKIYTEVPPGGESAEDVRIRVFGLLDELKKTPKGENILFVTHSFVAKMIYRYFHPDISDKEFFSRDLREAETMQFDF